VTVVLLLRSLNNLGFTRKLLHHYIYFRFFATEKLGFNEYRSRPWTVYFANTIQTNFWRFNGGGL